MIIWNNLFVQLLLLLVNIQFNFFINFNTNFIIIGFTPGLKETEGKRVEIINALVGTWDRQEAVSIFYIEIFF